VIQQSIEIGPVHVWLPGPMRLQLGLSGDLIREASAGFGYASRGIESRMLGKHFREAQVFFSRIEPESAFLLDRLYSEAVESAVEVEVGERVLWLREIASQLSELNLQLKYLSRMAHRFGLRILYHSILKHREQLLDLIELLSGSRFGYFFLIPGGARYDLTEGFQVRLELWLDFFLQDHGRISELFCWTHPFHDRLNALGVVLDGSEYGFVSRSAEGEYRHPLPESSSDVRVEESLESTRGDWCVELTLDREHRVETIAVQTPSDRIKDSIFPALEGESLEDLPVILESLSLSLSEVDR